MAAKKKAAKKSTAKKWTALRRKLASSIGEGLAGWFQLQGAEGLEALPGEDSARVVLCRIVHATGRYRVRTSQRPNNWPESSKKRMDVALLGVSTGSTGWYGAIEAKWPGKSFDTDKTRLAILQDCVRLTAVKSTNLNAKFLVLGGSADAFHELFDKPHTKDELERRRTMFSALLVRAAVGGKGKVAVDKLSKDYPLCLTRVPDSCAPKGVLVAELLAKNDALQHGTALGSALVWQLSLQRGRKKIAKKSAKKTAKTA